MYVVVAHPPSTDRDTAAVFQPLDTAGAPSGPAVNAAAEDLHRTFARFEAGSPRWVWESTRAWYPGLLAAGISVERCHDLALTRAVLAFSPYCSSSAYAEELRSRLVDGEEPSLPRQILPPPPAPNQSSLFDDVPTASGPEAGAVAAEFRSQLQAVTGSTHPRRLSLLLAAESAGALLAAEMESTGLPWRRDIHEELLERLLGARPPEGQRPPALERLATELREALGSPTLNPDSPQELIRALHRAGIEVATTRSWELEQQKHRAIGPLLAYKKLSRLLTANGWTWLDTWVDNGRFRPEYVVGGVVSGRWASRGGGALQIPRMVRDAVRPDPGHVLIVADAAQLEPRVLAALAQDSALATAARGKDLYQGIAEQGFGGDRAKAKLAMLGAMYGATTGESGRLMPQLARTYPRAIGVVEAAARVGESGGTVGSFLGRGCPPASERWRAAQRTTSAEEQRRADAAARSRGRFTRNFVVQSTAAEWALCWLAEVRRRLRVLGGPAAVTGIVFFLHDEVMLHVPEERAGEVSRLIEESAAAATELMFGRIPIEFAVNVLVVHSYADAK
ncbi:bifunctional 3'-5' exonuclease/DNA polymerase [Arthrobacter crusticola]|uniref:DNA-directed DNA polymerase n=1 Tax=Arthrobacter crusticola TaxID=2547960 RepID=A0A4R5TXH2_9MICC|nr:bifunctional 3'-5' exonuclease/DNA polymerase [Arthrobacter crusticola]TDK25901.1 bifunctional 3'-5' exonuclease/DNA polymerase [Arthrobacter crusticola]